MSNSRNTPEARKRASLARKKYNKAHYTGISILAPKELVADFRRKCRETGTSQASILKDAMQNFLEKDNN